MENFSPKNFTMEDFLGENPEDFPLETFRRNKWLVLVVYGMLMLVGGMANLAVLVTLARRRRRSRVELLMTHLAIADVCVTCGVIPLEIGWKYTNAWLAGNVLCKALLVLRAFGLYLSSNVLVCISLDRFFAVLYPLRLPAARRRSERMLWGAWIAALACSMPQSVVFRVMSHPRLPEFQQCVSFSAFSIPQLEVAYNVFCVCAMYIAPLAVIAGCYCAVWAGVTRAGGAGSYQHNAARGSITPARTRRRTLRMTVTIVAVFALCWLPYATMTLWYMIDRASASQVSPQVQDLLFAMAVSNSCMNPLVYGSYTLDCSWRRKARERCCCGRGARGERDCYNNIETRLVRSSKNHHVRFAETALSGSPPQLVTRVS